MKKIYVGLLWKFFAFLSALTILILVIVVFSTVKSKQKEILSEVQNRLQEVGFIISNAIDGNLIRNAINSTAYDLRPEEQNLVAEKVKEFFRFFSQQNPHPDVYNISILVPEGNNFRVFYTTQMPYKYLEQYPMLDELRRSIDGHNIELKTEYSENNQNLISSFSPIYDQNGNVVAVAKVDINMAELESKMPGFFSRFFVFMLPALALAFLASLVLSKKVTRPIDRYVNFVNTVSEGNYHLRLDIHTQDELEKIGHALNVMLERLEGLIETEADRDRLQQQITSLLRIVSAAADGDFTVSAEVTADTLGALADSFNLMVAELSKLIRDVKSASDQIAKSTHEILLNTEVMAQGAETQAKEIETTYRAAREMAEIIKYANERTLQAAESARKAAQVALAGTEVVKKSVEGMHRIRETVQETSRRVKLLGESSTEIGEIIEVISDIANRTNLLALNATIEAARAGDAGRGFAVVADEVRILAERSSQAAKDIAVLIESIQAGTSEAVMAMQHGTTEVEKGTKLVDEAGNALKDIMEMVQNSSGLITEISGAFQQQTKASSGIAQTMERIASIAQETAEGARKSKSLADTMERLSKKLNVAVAKFRLTKA